MNRKEHDNDEADAGSNPAGSKEGGIGVEGGKGKLKARRKPRWLRRFFLAAFSLLVIFVVTLPWIVSMPVVTNRALAFANDSIRGEIELNKLSVTWFGPTTIEGLAVVDPQERKVLSLGQLNLAPGVWKLLTSRDAFGSIVVDSPAIVLHLNEDNQASLWDAIAPVEGSAEEAAPADEPPAASGGELPALTGKISIKNGSVKIERDSASSYQAGEINGEFDLATLSDINGNLGLKLGDGSQVKCEVAVADLASGGSIDVTKASGSISVVMDRPARIGPLADVVLQREGMTGEAELKLDARIKPGDLSADFEANVKGFQTQDRASASASPLDASVTGVLAIKDNRLTAQTNLTGTPGTAQANLDYPMDAAVPEMSADEIVSALLGGSSISFPGFTLTVDSNIDLAAVDRAVPGLLNLPDGPALTGGEVSVLTMSVTGGEAPSVSGVVRVDDLRAKKDGKTTTFQPVSLDVDAALKSGTGLSISKADLTSGFATVNASGSLKELTARFQCDLSSARSQLGTLVDFGSAQMAGRLGGSLTTKRINDERIETALQVDAQQVLYSADDRNVDVPRATVKQTGHITLADKKVTRVDASQWQVDVDGKLVAGGAGWFDTTTQGFSANVDLQRADLDYLAQRAAGMGVKDLDKYAGNLSGKVSVDRASATDSLKSTGRLVAQRIAADGKPLLEGDATVNWSDATVSTADSRIVIPSAGIASDVANVNANGIKVNGDAGLVEDGKLDGDVDLAKLFRVLATIGGQDNPSDISGRLSFNAGVSKVGDGMKLEGTADVTPLEIGSGQNAIREDRVDLKYAATLDAKAGRLELGDTRITSKPLTAEISGSVDDYSGDMVMALRGKYDASWKELTAILHELAPSTAQLVVIEGKTGSEFSLTGPMNKRDTSPGFRNAQAKVAVGWDSADLMGVKLKKARITPELADGRLNVKSNAIAASQGKVRLGAIVDFTAPAATLRMPGKNKVLEGVEVTPELTRELLSHINPIFYFMASAEGTIDLHVNELVFPFDPAEQDSATGNGKLQLTDMLVEPSGFLKNLVAMGLGAQSGDMIAMTVRGAEFIIENGRINYDKFALVFPEEFDLVFSGSVGFDDTLDLIVSVPVRQTLLERLGVGAQSASYAKQLAGERVDIPIAGTRTQPELYLAGIDKQELLKKAVKGAAGESFSKGLEGFLQGSKKKDDKKNDKKKKGRKP
ncbi:MAG: hypothetical protein ACYTHJ_12890 [Planctomycetota bacterium]|jgi:hypothetical protein